MDPVLSRTPELVQAVRNGTQMVSLQTEFGDFAQQFPKFFNMLTSNPDAYTDEFITKLINTKDQKDLGLIIMKHCAPSLDMTSVEKKLNDPAFVKSAEHQIAKMHARKAEDDKRRGI